jgi:hypothetical protein
MTTIQWKEVRSWGNRAIGAVGLVGDEVVVIVSYYEDADGNMDGKVSWGERLASMVSPIRVGGSGITRVAVQAAADPDIVERDPGFRDQANQLFMGFAKQAVSDGIYAAYFSRAVGQGSGAIARGVIAGSIKQFIVKKGMEATVKKAFREATEFQR